MRTRMPASSAPVNQPGLTMHPLVNPTVGCKIVAKLRPTDNSQIGPML